MFLILFLNEMGVVEGLLHLPMVRNIEYVFSKELPRMSPERELEFTIDLKPGTKPISRMTYQMSIPEL
jgi:hypothetical protein